MEHGLTKEKRYLVRGEAVFAAVILINTCGVLLMSYSGAGISAISSVPFAFSAVFPSLSLGTWMYLFQGFLVLILMILRKKIIPQYLLSFVVGFIFGKVMDVQEIWIHMLPNSLGWRILYFFISYFTIGFGIALSNRCEMPIVPTDLFPRELAQLTGIAYSKIKTSYDVICLGTTVGLTGLLLGHIEGLGIGTVLAAFTMGKTIGMIGEQLDRHFRFVSF